MSAHPSGPVHGFDVEVTWAGPGERRTDEVRRFPRLSTAEVRPASDGVPALRVSAARSFFGDRDAWNPETLLLSALGQCHLLAFLRAAGLEGHRVTAASVQAHGDLALGADGAAGFVSASLRVCCAFEADPGPEVVEALHATAHRQCFIANSVSFPVTVLAG